MYQNIFIERGEGFGNDTVHLWDDELGYKTIPYNKFDYAYKADRNGNYYSMTGGKYRDWETDRKSTRLNSSHLKLSRMPSSA